MHCSACGQENGDNRRFCGACGAPLGWRCSGCGFENEPGTGYCGGCGRRPAGAAAALTDEAALLDGERKRISVLFADIVGSTALVAGLDAEAAVAALQPILSAMADAVHRFEGTVNKFQGDGLTALFGAPIAREDHAYRACAAALAIHEAVASLPGALKLRVGINTGEVVLRTLEKDLSADYDAGGPAVHLAARMEQLADPGTTCLTEATRSAAAGRIETRALGRRAVRGTEGMQEIFTLVGLVSDADSWTARAGAGLSRFTGRDREMALLRWALARSRQGAPQVISLCGEAGVGKSRLTHELTQEAEAAGWRVARAVARPEASNAALAPIAALFRQLLGIEAPAPPATGPVILAEKLEGLGFASSLPSFADLLDLGPRDPAWSAQAPERRRQQLFMAMRALLGRLAEERALLLVFEDLHWADRETQSALDLLVEEIPAAPLMVIASHRPEHRVAWQGKAHHRAISLVPLSGGALAAFVAALIGEDPSLAGVASQIAARTGGLPLFVEETVRALIEAGVLDGVAGDFRLRKAPDWSEVSGNVRDMIAARIDRLSPPAKVLLQIAAVIGESGPFAVLHRISAAQGLAFEATWPVAEASGLIRLEGAAARRFAFKHALMRDVAYMSLLGDKRRALHRAIFAAMEALPGGEQEAHLPTLAAHALAGEDWERAADLAFRAGERAIDRSAYRDAAALFEMVRRALEKLPAAPDRVAMAIDARLRLRTTLHQDGNIDRIDAHLEQAEGLARSIEDDRRLALVNLHRSYVLSTAGKIPGALAAAAQARELADALGDEGLIAEARLALGQANLIGGRFAAAFEILEALPQRFAGPRRGQRFGQMATRSSWCLALTSEALLGLGRRDEALALAERAYREAREIDRPLDIAWTARFLGHALLAMGRAESAHEVLQAGLEMAEAYDIRLIQPWLALALSLSALLAGDEAAAEAHLARAEAQAAAVQLYVCGAYATAARAAMARRAGRDDAAAEFAAAAGQTFAELGVEQPLILALDLVETASSPGGASTCGGR